MPGGTARSFRSNHSSRPVTWDIHFCWLPLRAGAKGELASVVLEVLVRVPVDVGDGHARREVRVPPGGEGHRPTQGRRGLTLEAALQGRDGVLEEPAHPIVVEDDRAADRSPVVDHVEGASGEVEQVGESTADG